MIAEWIGGQLVADRATLASFFGVSERTIRRHCRPYDYEPTAGRARGVGGRALYNADEAATALQDVVPRPARLQALVNLRRQIGARE